MIESEVKIRQGIDTFKNLLLEGRRAVIASSFGKDSEACLGLFLNACIELMNSGHVLPQQYLVTSTTLVENPEVEVLKQKKIRLLQDFCALRGLPLRVVQTSPSLAATWQVKVIGGKSLPTMVNSSHRQCTVDLKISANKKAVRAILKEVPREQHEFLFTVLGSRDSESVTRAKNIEKFGGSSSSLSKTADGDYFYPVKNFDVDDIWYFLIKSGQGKGKKYLSYLSSHDETVELYKDSAGECVMLQPDTNEDGVSQSDHSACGARHGCWTCGAMGGSGDKSMENLIESDKEKATYLEPLNRIRNFMVQSYYDLSKRRVTGRTLKNGYMKLAPDCFSAELCRDLLKACLTADYHEMKRAKREKRARMFQIITLEQLFAIDWSWSLSGLFESPFEALKVFKEVFEDNEFFVPGELLVEKQPMPKPRYVYVGDSWYEGQYYMQGIFVEHAGIADADSPCVSMMEVSKKGSGTKRVQSVNSGESLEVSLEVAEFVLEYELDHLLEKAGSRYGNYAAEYYLSQGLVSLPKRMVSKYDEMMARSQLMNRLGLTGAKTLEEISSIGISSKEYESLQRFGVMYHSEDSLADQMALAI